MHSPADSQPAPIPQPRAIPLTLTSDQAIHAIVFAEGDQLLAAERLGCNPADLISAIATDPTALEILNRQLRTLTTLQTFDISRRAQIVLKAELGSLEPQDLVKLLTQSNSLLGTLTDDKTTTQNINIVEHVMRQLPPNVREAVAALVEASASQPPSASTSTFSLTPDDLEAERSAANDPSPQLTFVDGEFVERESPDGD